MAEAEGGGGDALLSSCIMPFRDCDDGLSLNSCCVILCCVCLFVFISLEMIDESGRRLAKGAFFSTQRVEQRPEPWIDKFAHVGSIEKWRRNKSLL